MHLGSVGVTSPLQHGDHLQASAPGPPGPTACVGKGISTLKSPWQFPPVPMCFTNTISLGPGTVGRQGLLPCETHQHVWLEDMDPGVLGGPEQTFPWAGTMTARPSWGPRDSPA